MTCMKMMEKMSCSHKKDNSKKPDGKCENTSNCTVCPVCSMFVFQSQFDWHTKKIFFKKDFPLLNIGNISSYSSAIWKPPNIASYII